MNFLFIFSILTLMLTLLQKADCCSCTKIHPQTKFQDANFVAAFKIIKHLKGTHNMNPIGVLVGEVYKGTNDVFGIVTNRTTVICTTNNCNLYVNDTDIYVISGNITNGRLMVSSCSISVPWTNTSKDQRKTFKVLSKIGDECKVLVSSDALVSNTTHCIWEPSTKLGACQEKYGVCVSRRGQCMWNPSASYQKCIAKYT